MSKETNEQETPTAGSTRRIPMVIAIAVGLLVGGGAGALVAGPLLTKGPETAESSHDPEHAGKDKGSAQAEHGDDAEEKSSSEGGSHGEGTSKPVFLMDNLVLNPARSGGTRFLMVSIAFAVKDEAAVEELKGRDLEVRDAVLGVLGSKTVIELADVARRDSLKTELKSTVSPLFPEGTVKQIYFPQFVIQ